MSASAMQALLQKHKEPPKKRARIVRGPEDVPDGTHVKDSDDGSVESFERGALGSLLWRRPEAGPYLFPFSPQC